MAANANFSSRPLKKVKQMTLQKGMMASSIFLFAFKRAEEGRNKNRVHKVEHSRRHCSDYYTKKDLRNTRAIMPLLGRAGKKRTQNASIGQCQ